MDHDAPPFVMIVDDDVAVLDALSLSFSTEGYGVNAFATAEDVLAASIPETTGCLVVDYRLPGLNGLELLARLRARGVTSPAILITTSNRAVAALAAAAGVAVIEKPLLGPTLMDEVRRMTA